MPIPAGVHNALLIGPERYELTQCHFHAPSEHAVDGQRADVEAHFVHQDARGATLVLGAFYRLGPRPNPLLERVLLAAPTMAGTEVDAGVASPAALLQDLAGVGGALRHLRATSFYTYAGSLTTPGCTENARWFLLTDSGQVSRAALARFHQVIALFPDYGGYPNNNRPLQPLNGRVIARRAGA